MNPQTGAYRMFLVKGKLPNGEVVKMKSEAPDVFEAAKEFFNALSGSAAKDAAKKMPRLSFTYKDSAAQTFTIVAPKAKGAVKPKPTSKK